MLLYDEKMRDKLKSAVDSSVNTGDDFRLMEYLTLILEDSPRLKGLVNTRLTAVESYDYSFNGVEGDEEDALKLKFRDLINVISGKHLDVVLYGKLLLVANTEFNPITQRNELSLKYYNPKNYLVRGDVLKFRDNKGNTIQEIDLTLPESSNIFHYNDGLTYPGGILRTVAFYEYLKNMNIANWTEFNRRSLGIISAIISGETMAKSANALLMSDQELKDQLTGLDQVMADAGKTNYLKALDGITLQFTKLVEAAASSSFKDYKDMIDKDEAIAILGQANVTELPNSGGSRAALQVQDLVRGDIKYADIKRFLGIVNDFIRYDAKINLNAEPQYYYDVHYNDTIDIDVVNRTLQVAKELGIPLKKSEVYKKIDFDAPAPDDEIFTFKDLVNPTL